MSGTENELQRELVLLESNLDRAHAYLQKGAGGTGSLYTKNSTQHKELMMCLFLTCLYRKYSLLSFNSQGQPLLSVLF